MATDAAPPGIDRAGVDAWLAAHVPDAVPPFTYEQIAGGGSNLTFRVVDGQLKLPTRPGLGIELNRDALQKYRVDDLA